MKPSRKKAADTFEKVANEKNINLEKVDINWLGQMIMATQMCNYKTEKLFLHFVETALSNIPKQAILEKICCNGVDAHSWDCREVI